MQSFCPPTAAHEVPFHYVKPSIVTAPETPLARVSLHSPRADRATVQRTEVILAALVHAQRGADTALSGYHCDGHVASVICDYAPALPCFILNPRQYGTKERDVVEFRDSSALLAWLHSMRLRAHREHGARPALRRCAFAHCQPLPEPDSPDHLIDDTERCIVAIREIIGRRTAFRLHSAAPQHHTHPLQHVHAIIEGRPITALDPATRPHPSHLPLRPPFIVESCVDKTFHSINEFVCLADEAALRAWLTRYVEAELGEKGWRNGEGELWELCQAALCGARGGVGEGFSRTLSLWASARRLDIDVAGERERGVEFRLHAPS